MYDEYGAQGYLPIAVNLWENMETVVKPRARLYTFPILRDAGSVWALYNISNGIPLNYVIDPTDTVRFGATGFSETTIRGYIEQYLTGVSETPAVQPIEFTTVGASPAIGHSAVRFNLPKAANVTLRVYSTSGALVRTLASGQMPEGANTVNWNLRDNAGKQVGNGLYLYELAAGSQVAHAKVSVVK